MFLPSYDAVQSQKFDRIEFKVPINVTDAALSIFMAPPASLYDCAMKKNNRTKKQKIWRILDIDDIGTFLDDYNPVYKKHEEELTKNCVESSPPSTNYATNDATNDEAIPVAVAWVGVDATLPLAVATVAVL